MTAKGETNAMESMNSNELCLRRKKYEAFNIAGQITIVRTINSLGRREGKNKLLDIEE